jgi:hypothetical protein
LIKSLEKKIKGFQIQNPNLVINGFAALLTVAVCGQNVAFYLKITSWLTICIAVTVQNTNILDENVCVNVDKDDSKSL